MAVASPTTTGLTSPTGRATRSINEMKLTLVSVGIIGKQAAQHPIGIGTLFKPFQTTDPEIGIGVCLGGNGADSCADVRNSGPDGEMAGRDSNAEATVGGIPSQD